MSKVGVRPNPLSLKNLETSPVGEAEGTLRLKILKFLGDFSGLIMIKKRIWLNSTKLRLNLVQVMLI